MRATQIRPEFVEFIPDLVEDGVIYISIPYATSTHKCACGCGELVVLPVRPAEWALTWDGETVTLYPSIGNWALPCQSHYWIEHSKVVWARKWTRAEIQAGRTRDKRARERYFDRIRRSDPKQA